MGQESFVQKLRRIEPTWWGAAAAVAGAGAVIVPSHRVVAAAAGGGLVLYLAWLGLPCCAACAGSPAAPAPAAPAPGGGIIAPPVASIGRGELSPASLQRPVFAAAPAPEAMTYWNDELVPVSVARAAEEARGAAAVYASAPEAMPIVNNTMKVAGAPVAITNINQDRTAVGVGR